MDVAFNSIKGRNACILVDSEFITLWQYKALRAAIDKGLVVACVFQCTNTIIRRKYFVNLFYYLLNLLSMRHKWSDKIKWRDFIGDDVPVIRFESDYIGSWQCIPLNVIDLMKGYNIDFTIKYGMYLLKDPDNIPSVYGVFSYHHGDPSFYRGRPAGFYELLNGAASMGVMIQRLNNKLDGGEVFAFCSSKLFPYSYKKTLENAYGNGVYLLVKALQNAVNDSPINKVCDGVNYRLPSNILVIRFVYLLLLRKLKRLFYGAFVEKKWRLCFVKPINILGHVDEVNFDVGESPEISKNYSFIADPFPYNEDAILCEAMEKKSGIGVIIAITSRGQVQVDMSEFGHGHFSYPCIVESNGVKYLLPEMSSVGPQKIGVINENFVVSDVVLLKGVEGERLKDPTIFESNGSFFLFAAKSDASADALFLWYSSGISGPYIEHASSPIVINPHCARPAGQILNIDGNLFRLGQDNSGSYGNGVQVFCIKQLSVLNYSEEFKFEMRMNSMAGPHTVCSCGEKYVIDYYYESISLLAGVIRMKGLFNKLSRRFRSG